jgi:putative hemolysin
MPSVHSQNDPVRGAALARIAEVPGLAGKLAPVNKARELYQRVRGFSNGFHLENLLSAMRVELRVSADDQARIPASGPAVVVANHPYGVLDGAVLAVLLTRVREDVKVLTNSLLGDVPELQRHCIFVDPFQTKRSAETNRKALREALQWLQAGGMLGIFPAGEVSHWQMPSARVADPEWNQAAARLIRRTQATALPVYFCGHNSVGFQMLGMVHPGLRTAFLLHEFLQQQGRTVEVRVGSPMSAEAIGAVGDDREATKYLRSRTYLLARRSKGETSWPAALRTKLRTKLASKFREPLAEAFRADSLAPEIDALPQDRCLARSGDLAVYVGAAREIPQLLLEVGRLRELTFRGAGEGTGKSRDLDSFDDSYSHVLLWNRAKRELVGAYRAGNTAEILRERGIAGLYTSTLFRYDPRIFEKLGPALELGRSFVRPEYQRQYAPLLLLWKGIAQLVATRPQTPVLFGAVSVSNDYNESSREMIYRFFEERMRADDLAGLVEPRHPFRSNPLRRWDCRSLCRALRDLDELSQPIADVEADGKGLPILLRQYSKIGGKMVGFNVDRKFSNVLDGLVVVDLRRTEPAVLERYMGRDAGRAFREFHGLGR